MRGRLWSTDIREAVIHASQLGMGNTVIEAVTGVSERGIRRIISESMGGARPRRRCERKKLLDDQHCEVSLVPNPTIVHLPSIPSSF